MGDHGTGISLMTIDIKQLLSFAGIMLSFAGCIS